jgi:AraC-like DNA-binding protein/mannose-6-phosphate isomerase-like protein (cupin superfamily)
MERMSSAAATDVLAGLLDSVRVRTTIFCRSTLRAPWGFTVKAHPNASFHVVTAGDCWLELEGRSEPLRLRSGDLVVLPHSARHSLRDQPSSPTLWLEDLLETAPMDGNGRLRHGGDGATTELVCGSFELYGQVDSGPILRVLPPVVHVRGAGDGPAPWVAATLRLVGEITASGAPGATVVLARVADTMLIQALRCGLAEAGSKELGALRDPQIAAAVRLIHEQPERAWTVDELAAEAAYSRSAFALRFRTLVGESPMQYVRRTRLARAAMLLEQTNLGLGDVALRSGYASEASLSRAFRRAFGLTPGTYRRRPDDALAVSVPDDAAVPA